MSFNQTRAEKSESVQYRKTGRSGSSGGHRNYSGGGGGKGGGTGTGPPPSLSSNRSFKKPSNVQGVQSRLGSVSLDSNNNAQSQAQVVAGGSDAPVSAKSTIGSSQKTTRGVPKAPAATNTSAVSSTTMVVPSTPVKGGGFPLQFGSINPGLMQVPARTSSAPPNLDEQRREQAHYDSSRAIPALPTQSIPKQMPTNNSVTAEQTSAADAHSVPKARRDVQVAGGPHTTQSQRSSVHPVSGMPMQLPYHQSHIPTQFAGPKPQLQAQSMVNSSMPMPMTMPFPMGNHAQVQQQQQQQQQQQLYAQGLPPHMQPHGIMHPGQNVNFTSQMGTQFPHLGNIGININPQFPQQQPGEFGNTRKIVKITHPDTHEELSLVKKPDTYTEAGSSASRLHPKLPPQSQSMSSFPPGQPVNYYPNSYGQGPVFLAGPNSLPSTGIKISPSSQVPRSTNQVTVRPATNQNKEKLSESSFPVGSPTVEKTIPKIHNQEEEATSIHSQRDPEKVTVQSKSTIGASDSVCAASPVTNSFSTATSETAEHIPSMASSTTVGTRTNSSNRSKSTENDESTSGSSLSPETIDNKNSSPFPEAGKAQAYGRDLETASVPVNLKGDSTQIQETHVVANTDGIDSVKLSTDITLPDKPKHEAMETQERRNMLCDDSKEDAVEDKQQKLKNNPVFHGKGEADGDLSISTSGASDCSITESSSLSLESRIAHDGDKTSPDASASKDDVVGGTNSSVMDLGMLNQKSHTLSDPSHSELPCETEFASTELLPSSTDSKDKPVLDTLISKNSIARKKKRKEALQKADRAGTTADLYMAYKGPDEKKENLTNVDSLETTSINSKELSAGTSQKDTPIESKSEPDDWEDAADISTPKLEPSEDHKQLGEVNHHIKDESLGPRKYSRDFILKFSEQCKDLPDGFEITPDIAEALTVSIGNVPRTMLPSPGRNVDRSMGGSRSGRRGSGMGDDDRWSKVPGPLSPGLDIGYGNHGSNVYQHGGNVGVLKNPRAQSPVMYSGGIQTGPMQYMNPQFGMQRTNSDADKWQRATAFQRGLIPSPRTPAQVMHKAERKYVVGKITDEEQAKQRQLKGILNKLTPQNFERLFEQVKQVSIDNAGTLTGVISQIFDKALMEPTFCEMYADFCYHLAGELPDFNEDNEKITFKRLLLNKCQEEFERGEREQEEANRAQEEGEAKQSDEEREEKRVQARRRMLGNIRLIGELYKKRMLTERIMHECIKKLLGQYQNPDEEDVEALCKLMSTIGEMIDHPKAKEHMDAYFDMMAKLSNNMKLSSRVRFMLKDSIDLRKNKWQQRRKVEGPKKIEEVHRDAANERQAQTNRLARGPSMGSSFRRAQQPMDFAPRGSNVLLSPNTHMGGFRGVQPPRGYANQDIRTDERHHFDNRNMSVPLPQRPLGNDSITLVPQGGLARGMSIRGQPLMSHIPFSDMHNPDSRRTTTGNGYGSVSDRPPYTSREEIIPRFAPDRFVGPGAHDHMNLMDGNSTYGNREVRNQDHSFSRSRPNTPPARRKENISSEKVWPEEQLRKMSMETIKEFYSAKDEKEVALCVKDLNSPSFYPSMISIWITDSFERKDMERGLLAKLLVNLTKSRDSLLSQPQLVEGFQSVLASLEDTVTDAPKAPEFLGSIFAKVVLENVLPMTEVGRLIYEGGEVQGQLVETGLAAEVLGSVLDVIQIEKGEPVVKDICTGSSLRLENFRPPNIKKTLRLDKYI